MFKLLRGSLLLMALSATACGSDSSSAPSDDALDFGTFDAELEQFLQENDLAGATAIVLDRELGVLHRGAYGEFELDRVMLLASASKILTAGVLVRLDDQGVLDLDAPVGSYISDWGARDPDVSVAQMISNSSGMVGLVDEPAYAPYLCQFVSAGSLAGCGAKIYGADDAALKVAPDTRFRYGGGQWQLAGAAAEQASGKSWAELVQETYVDGCGADGLGYSNHYQQSLLAGGKVEDAFAYPAFFSGDVTDLPETDNPNMEGGGYANVEAYSRVLLMHLRGGESDGAQVLSAAGVARMQEDRIAAAYDGTTNLGGDLEGYGMGWWVDRNEPGVVVDGGAYGAMPWIDNNRGYAVIILLEAEARLGASLRSRLKPTVDALYD